jgi:hypothetical protein
MNKNIFLKNIKKLIFFVMQLKTTIILFSLSVSYVTIGQVGIGTNTPHASAALEVLTTNKGFLAPRVALTSNSDVATIASPATGLMIYNTATAGTSPNVVVPGYYYYSGLKWERLVTTTPDATVEFNTANPSTGSPTFTPNTPASADYIYVSSVDASLWVWNGSAYVTFVAPASTAWNLANTTNDAGNNKTANIWRSGNIGIGMNNPTVPLEIQSTLVNTYVTTARFLAPSNTTAGNSTLLNFGVSATTGNCADWRYVYQANGAASNRVDFGMSGYAAPMLSYLNSGNVGIGTTTPLTKLHLQGPQATLGANASATMLRMSRPTWSGYKYGSAAQFNLGTYDDGVSPVNSKSRLDLVLANVDEALSTTPTMTWLANGYVGIGNTAPAAPLVVQGLTGTGSLKLLAPSVASGDNWWIGFGHGSTSTDANDRARIGAEIIAGGAGRLFFTTGPTGTQTRAMFIDESQRVGIGTSTPASKLDVSTGVTVANSIVNATGSINDYLQYNIQNTSTGTQAQSGYSATANNGSATSGFAWLGINNSNFNFPTSYNIGGANDVSFIGSGQDLYVANANNTKSIIFSTGKATTPFFGEQMRILNNGNVGIGSSAPLNKLVVKGLNNPVSALGTAQTNAIFRVEGESNHSLDMGTFSSSPWGSYIQSHNKASTASLPLSLNPVGGNVGIGTSTPDYKLSVIGNTRIQPNTTNTGSGGGNLWVEIYGKEPPATDTQAGGIKLGWYNNFGGIEVVRPGSVTGVGLAFNYATTGGTTTEGFRLTNAGRVGIGTTAPGSTLEVNGSATNTTAFNAGASSTIDFSNSNLAYTSASPGAFTLSNIKDGGTYTLSVQGTTSGTASFSATGFTFKSTNNAQTIAGKHTLYTFMVIGTTAYFNMSTGF